MFKNKTFQLSIIARVANPIAEAVKSVVVFLIAAVLLILLQSTWLGCESNVNFDAGKGEVHFSLNIDRKDSAQTLNTVDDSISR